MSDSIQVEAVTIETAHQDPKVVKLYHIAKVWASGNEVTPGSILNFVTVLISSIESIVKEKGQGEYKKEAVMTVLRLVFKNDVKMKPEDRDLVMNLLAFTVPTFIDTAVGIARGDIDLGKLFRQTFSCCFPRPSHKK